MNRVISFASETMSSAPQTIASVPDSAFERGGQRRPFGGPAGQAVLDDFQVDVLAAQLAAELARADGVQTDDVHQQRIADARRVGRAGLWSPDSLTSLLIVGSIAGTQPAVISLGMSVKRLAATVPTVATFRRQCERPGSSWR